MKIVKMPLTKMNPAHYNPRRDLQPGDPDYDKLKKSIQEFDLVEPLVWNQHTGRLVGGHQRLKILKELGYTETEVSIVDLPPEKEKALNLALNKISGEWDMPLLKDLLEELDTGAFDIEITGFDEKEIEILFNQLHQNEAQEDDFDADAEVGKITEPISKPGDIWQLGRHRLMCGDSTSADDVRKLLAGVEPLLMVTDPPYGVEYDPDWRNRVYWANDRAIGKVKNDDNADWREAWALFPGDVAYVWHADRHASAVQQSLEVSGFEIRCQIIWSKPRFVISRGHYHWQHEPCWYAVRKGKTGHWVGDRSQTTLWNIEHLKSETGHGTQKPIECMARPIKNNSSPGQAVYDPFVGSGTTLIAAEQLGRSCYVMELDPKYCDVICQRYENFTGKKAELSR